MNHHKRLCQNSPFELIQSVLYLNAPDNTLWLFDHVFTCKNQIDHGKSDRPCQGQTVVDLSCGEWILSSISSFHRPVSKSARLKECMNELCALTVSLESHKDNLVLCNLVRSAQVLVHVSTRGKNKSMTDKIMCQKIYGWSERMGETA